MIRNTSICLRIHSGRLQPLPSILLFFLSSTASIFVHPCRVIGSLFGLISASSLLSQCEVLDMATHIDTDKVLQSDD